MVNMHGILKNMILLKTSAKEVLETKIWTSWAAGNLTDEEKEELLQLVFENLNPQTEAPELTELYLRLESKMKSLETEISEMKAEILQLQTGTPAESEDGEIVPEWEPWNGIDNKYQFGSVVRHFGIYYQDVLENIQNVWEPGTVDERYWKVITKEEAERIASEL